MKLVFLTCAEWGQELLPVPKFATDVVIVLQCHNTMAVISRIVSVACLSDGTQKFYQWTQTQWWRIQDVERDGSNFESDPESDSVSDSDND